MNDYCGNLKYRTKQQGAYLVISVQCTPILQGK